MVDATAIIHLSRVGRLDLLGRVFGRLVVPEEVRREVETTFLRESRSMAAEVDARLRANPFSLRPRTPTDEKMRSLRLGPGELACLTIARSEGHVAIIDERRGRRIGRVFGIRVHGTIHILYRARELRALTGPEAVTILQDLVRSGFYISDQLLKRATAELHHG